MRITKFGQLLLAQKNWTRIDLVKRDHWSDRSRIRSISRNVDGIDINKILSIPFPAQYFLELRLSPKGARCPFLTSGLYTFETLWSIYFSIPSSWPTKSSSMTQPSPVMNHCARWCDVINLFPSALKTFLHQLRVGLCLCPLHSSTYVFQPLFSVFNLLVIS